MGAAIEVSDPTTIPVHPEHGGVHIEESPGKQVAHRMELMLDIYTKPGALVSEVSPFGEPRRLLQRMRRSSSTIFCQSQRKVRFYLSKNR